MRVLKEVNIEKKHKCKYCKSIFTYKQKDVDRIWYNNIRCPVCKQVMPVSVLIERFRRKELRYMLSEEEKKAIERIDTIQDLIIEYGQYNADIEDMEYFSKILNLIEKQNKIIDKMAEDYLKRTEGNENTIQEVIDYFTKLVEKE